MNNSVIKENQNMIKITFKLALPAITEMLLQTFMGIADTAMVGSLGGFAIAAVSLADNPVMVLLAFFAAISVGTTALVARFVGAKKYEKAKETMVQSLYISIVFSIIFTLIALFFAKNILVWMGAEKDVFPYAFTYIRIVFLGLPAMIITLIMSGALRGTGDTKTPMLVNGLSNTINVIGNFLLIFESRTVSFTAPFSNRIINIFIPGAGMGVTGAALATTFGRVIAVILILKILFSKKRKYNIRITKNFNIDKQIIKRILNVGMPAAIEQFLFRFAQLAYFRIITSLGTVMIASHKIALTAESLSYMPGWGFALASTTLVGQYLGSEEPENASKAGFIATLMAGTIMSIFGILFFIFPHFFIRIFIDDQEIIKNSTTCLKLVAISQPFLASTMVFSGGLRGAGYTKTVLIVTSLSVWGIRVFLGYILTFHLNYGLKGAWIAMVVDLSVRGTLFLIIFKRGKWKSKKI